MEAKQFEGAGLRYQVVEPEEYQPDRPYPLVVLLHGYGSNMRDLAALCPPIDRRGYLFALPNAPLPIQIGIGAVGYAWSEPPEAEFDAAGVAEEQVGDMVEDVMERYRVAAGDVVLGGFSQGGILTYRVGLPRPDVYRGLVALSSRILGREKAQTRLPARRDQPVFIAHGTMDTMIAVEAGRQAREFLTDNGYEPEYCEYEMAHQITAEVLADLTIWLHGVLPPATS